MGWGRKLLVAMGLIVAIVVGCLVYGLYNVDALVKAAIEKYGSEAVASQVVVGQVNVNLKDAKVILKNLRVDNPEGFTEKTAFSAGYVEVDLDEDKLNTSKITIRKVLIKEPLVTFEHANGEDNLSKLQKSALAYAEKLAGSNKKEDSANSTKVFIHNIDLTDGKIFLKDSRLMGASMTLPLPNIHISKIQTGPDGSSPEEIAGQVMENLFSSSKHAVGQSASSIVEQSAKELKDAGKEAGKTVKAVKDAGSGLTSSVKKLFSRD